MRGRFGVGSPYVRESLGANWSLAASGPGDAGPSESPDDSEWTAIEVLAPVSAALRALQRWSLDHPATRFDSQNWWYRRRFDAPLMQTGDRVTLGLDGLATVANVWINGVEVLRSDNMFVAHECDVTAHLLPTGNTLLLRFSSLDSQLAIRRKRPRWRAPMIENQQLRWFRTTLLGRTPGWSPPVAVVGPWRDVWLERRRLFELTDVRLDAQVRDSWGVLQCNLNCGALGGATVASVDLHLEGHGQSLSQRLPHIGSGFQGELRVPDVALWWPHTHGDAALYSVSLVVRMVGLDESSTVSLGRVGFRTVLLDRTDGEFSLSVNGVPIFCRGACWTPLDPVSLRSSSEDCMVAAQQVLAAGMNMLRVSGTMVYEEDHFYDACDELGILVWQDFMFANMDYPSEDADFMHSVETEVLQLLNRLRSRACLALLCGNSEVAQQAAMWGAPRALWSSELFEDTLAQYCLDMAPTIPYWPSSAYEGAFPHQADVGTTSYYGVGAYLRDKDDARRAGVKFATECLAFANVPEDSTIERMPTGLAVRVHHPAWKMRSPRDLGAGWDFDDVRDYYLSVVFDTDPQKLRYSDHERFLTLSRITSGEVMAAVFSEWRRPASSCRGAIVLFLRDLWAGAGWGILDDSGSPKACYHYLKRVLQPVTVILSDEGGNGLFAHLINESGVERQLTLKIDAWRGGEVLVTSGQKIFPMGAHSAQSVACMEFFDHFLDMTFAYRFGPIPCDAVVATLYGEDGCQITNTFHFPLGLNDQRESDVGLSAIAVMLDDCTAKVTIRTKRLAQSVHFCVPGYVAEDEYFHLAPGTQLHVILRANQLRPLMGVVRAINSVNEVRLSPPPC